MPQRYIDLRQFKSKAAQSLEPTVCTLATRSRQEGGEHVFGHCKWDNSDWVEDHFPFHSTHFHSLDETLIVGDGTPAFVFTSGPGPAVHPAVQVGWGAVCRPQDPGFPSQYVGRVPARWRSNNRHAHCHPRLTPDGRAVLYTSDLTSYSNMYLVEVGDFDELPDLG